MVPSLTVTVSPALNFVDEPPLDAMAVPVVKALLLLPVTVTRVLADCSAWLATFCAEDNND